MGTVIPEFTTVVGVDAKHLDQLRLTWPTWKKHKSTSLLRGKMLIFYDCEQVNPNHIRLIVDHPDLKLFPWPPKNVTYSEGPGGKWGCAQRYKMLAGFVHVPMHVNTPYWLKLDTDTIASGMDDWIDPNWFEGNPAIIAHRWSFTKPGDQILKLDRWVEDHPTRLKTLIELGKPLNLAPRPGSERLSHKRVISWCGFFHTGFTRLCSKWANDTCGFCQLPVKSQDGFAWYCATRLGLKVLRVNMKERGVSFVHRSSKKGIVEAAREAME